MREPANLWGQNDPYVKLRHTLEFVSFITWNCLRHAEDRLGFVGTPRYNTLIQTNERHDMSNIIKVPHTVTFLAEINLDTIPTHLIPALVSLSEEALTSMCKEATVAAIEKVKLVEVANEGAAGWAYLTLTK